MARWVDVIRSAKNTNSPAFELDSKMFFAKKGTFCVDEARRLAEASKLLITMTKEGRSVGLVHWLLAEVPIEEEKFSAAVPEFCAAILHRKKLVKRHSELLAIISVPGDDKKLRNLTGKPLKRLASRPWNWVPSDFSIILRNDNSSEQRRFSSDGEFFMAKSNPPLLLNPKRSRQRKVRGSLSRGDRDRQVSDRHLAMTAWPSTVGRPEAQCILSERFDHMFLDHVPLIHATKTERPLTLRAFNQKTH